MFPMFDMDGGEVWYKTFHFITMNAKHTFRNFKWISKHDWKLRIEEKWKRAFYLQTIHTILEGRCETQLGYQNRRDFWQDGYRAHNITGCVDTGFFGVETQLKIR